ncbi:response regulator [Catenovulum maritimum]|uniref:LuxR family transcriptional regulator n=1 Tax=Catenovulum maritimum TaxID=1513271 RepID=A0A0J8JIU0_9ALTE|nr:response regulator [Catenovulum maritimum]KMT64376.1 LuxR family transcriptional regulator [Catenovulum maritimum]
MSNKISDVVLVVDDSPESLGMLNVALNQAGYTALVALSGAQALSIADKVHPDVILMDGVMPELDGFETCRLLKQKLPNVPVIFMTGLTDIEDVVRGFDAGGVDYVTKPIAPDEVIARIKTHVQTSKLALSAQQALDDAGRYVFCIDNAGNLNWATPHVYELIESIANVNDKPWMLMMPELKKWLPNAQSAPLILTCFTQAVEVAYQREQDGKHLLRISQSQPKKTAADLKAALGITKREAEVLFWVSSAKSNWEISQILEMSPRTVTKHLEQIYKKLEVDNRTAAAAISIRILEGD